jgi:hypothetical protein
MSENDSTKLGITTQDLVDEIERILKDAASSKDDFGAVNWGDIGVASVEYRIPIWPFGDPYCCVLIGEASPECGLPSWIDERLDKSRFKNVYIECEW